MLIGSSRMARCVLAVALAAAALAAMDELPARFHLSPELDGRTRHGVPWRKSVAEAQRAAQSVEASPLHGGANNIVAYILKWLHLGGRVPNCSRPVTCVPICTFSM